MYTVRVLAGPLDSTTRARACMYTVRVYKHRRGRIRVVRRWCKGKATFLYGVYLELVLTDW
jgi:hypothetical protein